MTKKCSFRVGPYGELNQKLPMSSFMTHRELLILKSLLASHKVQDEENC